MSFMIASMRPLAAHHQLRAIHPSDRVPEHSHICVVFSRHGWARAHIAGALGAGQRCCGRLDLPRMATAATCSDTWVQAMPARWGSILFSLVYDLPPKPSQKEQRLMAHTHAAGVLLSLAILFALAVGDGCQESTTRPGVGCGGPIQSR